MNDLFNTIKTSILGTKTSDIDKQIDDSFRSIERYSVSSDRNKYLDQIKSLISQVGGSDSNSLLKSLQSGVVQIQNFDQGGRLSRYVEYEAITKKISYCQRALETLVDHIISPDDITKTSLQIMADVEGESTALKTSIARCKKIEKKLKLENKIKSIVKTTLKKGDNFIEIVVTKHGNNLLNVLHEGSEINITDEIIDIDTSEYDYVVETRQTNGSVDTENKKLKVQLEASFFSGVLTGMKTDVIGSNVSSTGKAITSRPYSPPPISKDDHQVGSNEDKFKAKYDDPKSTTTNDSEDQTIRMRDVFVAVHDPKFVIRLETERFKTCLGYLIFPKIDPRMASVSSSMMTATMNSVDALCANLLQQIQKSLRSPNESIKISDDMKNIVLSYLNTIEKNEDLKVRYVPPELMIHWRINHESFEPYGESIFECVNYDCRLLMALKTAQTIKRLTYATDKRVVSVETGLPRDAKNIIETIKEGLNKKKVSVDTMGSINTIPSQIPTFETIYIPMRDGKKFVEFDKMEWGMNPQDDVEPLKFIRDNIVANLGVPAPYLGLEENTSNRSLLTVENINFTRTIISFQKELSVCLKEMFEKIYKLIYPDYENLERIQITFQEPRISPYEHQMEYVEQMQRLIEALRTLGVPVEYMKKKYLPHLDWDEIEKFSAIEDIKKEISEVPSDQQSGMGGVLGQGGGMY